jgi:hypothetical protein
MMHKWDIKDNNYNLIGEKSEEIYNRSDGCIILCKFICGDSFIG